MKSFIGACLLLLTLGGCGYSVEEVQDAPVALTVKVPAAWDVVGTCLAAHYTSGFETTYLPVPSERRGKLIVKMIGPGIVQYRTIMYVFDVAGGEQTTVIYRRRPIGFAASDDLATRELIERCGKA